MCWKNNEPYVKTSMTIVLVKTKHLFLFVFALFFFLIGCKQKLTESKQDLVVINELDSSDCQMRGLCLKEIITDSIADKFLSITDLTLKESSELMDVLYERINASPVKHNLSMWYVVENRVHVNLIDCTEVKVAEFEKQIIRSPAIVFEESAIPTPPPICDTCGFTMSTNAANYFLPVDTIEVTIRNENTFEGMTGSSFLIEYYEKGAWRGVPLNYLFNSIGYDIYAKQSASFTIDLQPLTYDYKGGRYRVYKKVFAGDKDFSVVAYFTILP